MFDAQTLPKDNEQFGVWPLAIKNLPFILFLYSLWAHPKPVIIQQ